MENTEKKLTLGEERVHLNFNPSSDDKIGTFKKMIAEAIDFLIKEFSENSEANRCLAIAMTELETAQMYGVKAIAKNLK